VGASAWNKLFDETMAGLMFTVEGEPEELNLEATLNLLTDPARPGARRRRMRWPRCSARTSSFSPASTTRWRRKRKSTTAGARCPRPQHGRHLSNHVEPEVVEALRNAVVAAYPKLSHRYYRLKAKWMGLEKLQVWDRNAPLPTETPRLVDWAEARRTVTEAYAAFDPRMADLATPFFDKGWIDAGVKPGKAPGAFAHPTVTTSTPTSCSTTSANRAT
jgi:oligoendopeptidase F